MMRRLTALWICIALLAGLAAGCSARPATGPEIPEETAMLERPEDEAVCKQVMDYLTAQGVTVKEVMNG